MKRNLFACAAVLLLSGCANFAGINWTEEMASTHWRGIEINPSAGPTLTLYQGKLAPYTRLNKSGLAKMEAEGCMACHENGGAKPDSRADHLYKEDSFAGIDLAMVQK